MVDGAPVGQGIKMTDGRVYVFRPDGSLRHAVPRLRGKAAVKAAKRRRHR